MEEESKKIEAGYVISQETEPNEEVFAGDTVVIHVSTGVKKSAVESVIGKSEEEAKKTLSGLGLKVDVVYDEDLTKDNGVVLKQSIDPGKEVEEGTSITVTVNKISETKTANLTINIKSLLGGKVDYEDSNNTDENGTSGSQTVKKVRIKIMAGDEMVCDEETDPTMTNFMQSISGRGTVRVKVIIDDLKKWEGDINLNTTSKYTID